MVNTTNLAVATLIALAHLRRADRPARSSQG